MHTLNKTIKLDAEKVRTVKISAKSGDITPPKDNEKNTIAIIVCTRPAGIDLVAILARNVDLDNLSLFGWNDKNNAAAPIVKNSHTYIWLVSSGYMIWGLIHPAIRKKVVNVIANTVLTRNKEQVL